MTVPKSTSPLEPLRSRGRKVIRASIDRFHNPSAVRYRQGRTSSRGYYEDSFDLDGVLSCILLPLGPTGNRNYKVAQFDFRTDAPVESTWQVAPVDALLLFEGIFLHRPEFLPHWDFTVFVDTSFDVTIWRAFTRDQYLFQTEDRTREIYQQRYIPGQELYLSTQQPVQRANVVLRNDDIQNPVLVIKRPANHALEATP
jgi:uridine kinase